MKIEAQEIRTGDRFVYPKKFKGIKTAGTIIRETDTDISDSCRKAVKKATLIVLDGKSKVIIPNKEVIIVSQRAQIKDED